MEKQATLVSKTILPEIKPNHKMKKLAEDIQQKNKKRKEKLAV